MRRPTLAEAEQFRARILAWFAEHGRRFPWRRSSATLYELVISEVLLQRTRAEVVSSFVPGFIRRYPSWRRLAEATEGELGKSLRSLGLWKRRARSLLALAHEMRKRGGRLPRVREDIERLPGVGQYIANAIGLFASKRADPLLDVNMARVLERCFGPRRLADIRYDPLLQEVARLVVCGPEPARLNWGILDLAATVCRRSDPACSTCPLADMCPEGLRRTARSESTARKLARRRPMAARGTESRLV